MFTGEGTAVLSHPFRKVREMDGAPRILLTRKSKMLLAVRQTEHCVRDYARD